MDGITKNLWGGTMNRLISISLIVAIDAAFVLITYALIVAIQN